MILGTVLLLILLVPGVWAIVDAALVPTHQWERVHVSKVAWLTVLIVATLAGLGVPGAIAYSFVARRRLQTAAVV